MPFNPTTSTRLAKTFADLHRPGDPVLLTNVWDPPSTSLVLSQPATKAIATASFAIAAVAGIDDDALDLETNLAAVRAIAARIAKEGKADSVPLSVDFQDGYGDRLEEGVKGMVELGAVGCNVEDVGRKEGSGRVVLIDAEEHAERVRRIIEVAKGLGVDGFVVNARTDCIKLGGTVEEAIRRGKLYLEAGATTVFVWGGSRNLRDQEVRDLVKELQGRVSVIYRKGLLSVTEVKELGVARISMGPGLWRAANAIVEEEIKRVLAEFN